MTGQGIFPDFPGGQGQKGDDFAHSIRV